MYCYIILQCRNDRIIEITCPQLGLYIDLASMLVDEEDFNFNQWVITQISERYHQLIHNKAIVDSRPPKIAIRNEFQEDDFQIFAAIKINSKYPKYVFERLFPVMGTLVGLASSVTASFFTAIAVRMSVDANHGQNAISLISGIAYACISFINYFESYANHYFAIAGRKIDNSYRRKLHHPQIATTDDIPIRQRKITPILTLTLGTTLTLYIIVNCISLYQDRKSLSMKYIHEQGGSIGFLHFGNVTSVISWGITALSFSGGFLIELLRKSDYYFYTRWVDFSKKNWIPAQFVENKLHSVATKSDFSSFVINDSDNSFDFFNQVVTKLPGIKLNGFGMPSNQLLLAIPAEADNLARLEKLLPKLGLITCIPFAVGTSFFGNIALQLTFSNKAVSYGGAGIAFCTIMIDYYNSGARDSLRIVARGTHAFFDGTTSIGTVIKKNIVVGGILTTYTILSYTTLYYSLLSLTERAEEKDIQYSSALTTTMLWLTIIPGVITSLSFNGSFLYDFSNRIRHGISRCFNACKQTLFNRARHQLNEDEEAPLCPEGYQNNTLS